MIAEPPSAASQLEAWLSRFDANAAPIDGTPWTHRHDGGQHGGHIVFGTLVHGDEVGTLPGVVAAVEALGSGELNYGGKADFFVGNVAAGRAGQRALEADLNRVFLADQPDSLEYRRAKQLMPILDACEVFVDFHQTSLPAISPFYTLPWRPSEAAWIRAFGKGHPWISRPFGVQFTPGTCCADEYLRDQGKVGITLELGQMGFRDEAAGEVERVIRRALFLMDARAKGESIEEFGATEPETPLYRYAHNQPHDNPDWTMRPGLVNFDPVHEGEDLSAEGSPEIIAPCDGVILFPKYPKPGVPSPGMLYRIAQKVGGPEDL